mmetsp:Transcript_21211/g.38511  ORF Transcript_21211/g.38511 Transcript_21211/m.38511 type:complete len:129 (+) Transcript_21211:1587-1973(+)
MDAAGSEGSREFEFADDLDLSERVPITAREYGQARKGSCSGMGFEASGWREALSVRSSMSSAYPKTIRVDSLAVAEAGAILDLEPPAAGRLPLLSGVTATFSPGTMTALMGSSGAGKTTLYLQRHSSC